MHPSGSSPLCSRRRPSPGGGAGSQASPEFWNLPVNGNPGRNDDATHWNQSDPPDMSGTDDAVINGGGIKKNAGLDFSGGSSMTLNSGAYFQLTATATNPFSITGGSSLLINDGQFDANVQFVTVSGSTSTIEVVNGSFIFNSQTSSALGLNDGASAIVRSGGLIETTTFFNSQNAGATVGGTFTLDGGTLLASGAQSNPIRASNGLDGGGFDFPSLGGSIRIDDYTGGGTLTSYLQGKATTGFFKIDGTTASGFGEANAINGEWLEFVGSSTAGSLMLVPEPSIALLGSLGLWVILRRRR